MFRWWLIFAHAGIDAVADTLCWPSASLLLCSIAVTAIVRSEGLLGIALLAHNQLRSRRCTLESLHPLTREVFRSEDIDRNIRYYVWMARASNVSLALMVRRDIHAARQILARNLRRFRLDRGLTQEELANAAGLRQALISELEAGKLDVRLDTLSRVAIALDATLAELFHESKRG